MSEPTEEKAYIGTCPHGKVGFLSVDTDRSRRSNRREVTKLLSLGWTVRLAPKAEAMIAAQQFALCDECGDTDVVIKVKIVKQQAELPL